MSWGEEIDEDLSWREAELASLKALCAKSSNEDTQRALLRAMWALMYAHYEGFHKFCWDILLNYIENEKVARGDVTDSFAMLSLSSAFKRFRGDISTEGIWRFLTTSMPAEMKDLAVFPDKLEAQSNLWPNVARENNAKVNITCEYLDAHETKLKLIVKRRNEIAHGKKLVVSKISDYQEYEDAALTVMLELAVQVIDCLDNKRYLASAAPTAP